MTDAATVPPPVASEADIDENGVDLAQIRAMLDLTPEERLSRMAAFMRSLIEVRDLNGTPRSG